MPTPRQLADRFQTAYLTARPFEASMDGIPGYDHLVPDASEAGDSAWRSVVDAVLAEARALDRTALSGPDAVTLDCVVEYAEQELLELDSAAVEHTVTAMPFSGPAVLQMSAAIKTSTAPLRRSARAKFSIMHSSNSVRRMLGCLRRALTMQPSNDDL